MTRTINKWTKSHESLQQDYFHHINILFLEAFFASKNTKAPCMVYTIVSSNTYQLALLVEFQEKQGLLRS